MPIEMTALPSGTRVAPSPMARLIALLKPERGDIGVICFFSIITGVLYLATPLAVDAVVQNIAFGGQQQVYLQTLLIFSFALLVFLILLSMISAVQHAVAELIQQRIFVRLSADLAYRLPRLRLESLEKAQSIELINRFLDVTTLQKSSALILLDAVNVLLSAFIGLIVLAFYHPFLLAFDMILVIILLLVFFGFGKGGVRSSIQESYAKHAVAGWFEQLVMFPLLFKWEEAKSFSMGMADRLVNDYLSRRKEHYRILLRQIIGLLGVQAVASAALLAMGGWLVLRGELTLGQLVASELIVSAIVAAMVHLGKHVEAWYDAMAATDKLGSLVDLQIESEEGESLDRPEEGLSLRVNNLQFAFDQQRPLFRGFGLNIARGEVVGLTGPVGAGAGTLLEILYGLRNVGEGMVFYEGKDLRHLNLNDLRSRVVFLRRVELFDGSVLDNLRLGNDNVPMSAVYQALDDVGMLDRIRRFPDGVKTRLKPGGRPLSDAERIKVCVARALLVKPALLLIDRALDGLDPETSTALFKNLFESHSGMTLMVATRDRAILKRCGRVIQIHPDDAQAGQATANLEPQGGRDHE